MGENMKTLVIATILFSISAFAQTNSGMITTQHSQNLEGDQSEAMIENSLIFRKYDQAMFDRAQAEGKSILVIVSKSDCPSCRVQAPTLAKVLKESKYGNIEIFQTDYINQPDLNKKFNATGWTLLIGFKGTREVNRSYGLKRPSELKNFLMTLL